MPKLQLSHAVVQESPKVLCFRIAGDVDYLDVTPLEERAGQVLRQEQPRHVLLDLGGLSFVVTPFLGSLLFWKDEVSKAGGQLVLFGLTTSTDCAVRHLRLDRVLTICKDREAALAALAGGSPPENASASP